MNGLLSGVIVLAADKEILTILTVFTVVFGVILTLVYTVVFGVILVLGYMVSSIIISHLYTITSSTGMNIM